ncbi:hypothetical protein ACRAWD_07200 [Caulobacter segnis]
MIAKSAEVMPDHMSGHRRELRGGLIAARPEGAGGGKDPAGPGNAGPAGRGNRGF